MFHALGTYQNVASALLMFALQCFDIGTVFMWYSGNIPVLLRSRKNGRQM